MSKSTDLAETVESEDPFYKLTPLDTRINPSYGGVAIEQVIGTKKATLYVEGDFSRHGGRPEPTLENTPLNSNFVVTWSEAGSSFIGASGAAAVRLADQVEGVGCKSKVRAEF